MELHHNGVTVLATLWAGVILLAGVTFSSTSVPQILPTLAAFTVFGFRTVAYFIAWLGNKVSLTEEEEVKRAPAREWGIFFDRRAGLYRIMFIDPVSLTKEEEDEIVMKMFDKKYYPISLPSHSREESKILPP